MACCKKSSLPLCSQYHRVSGALAAAFLPRCCQKPSPCHLHVPLPHHMLCTFDVGEMSNYHIANLQILWLPLWLVCRLCSMSCHPRKVLLAILHKHDSAPLTNCNTVWPTLPQPYHCMQHLIHCKMFAAAVMVCLQCSGEQYGL